MAEQTNNPEGKAIRLKPGQGVYDNAQIEELFKQRDEAKAALAILQAEKEQVVKAVSNVVKMVEFDKDGNIDYTGIMGMLMGGNLPETLLADFQFLKNMVANGKPKVIQLKTSK